MKNEKVDDAPVKPKTHTTQECREMVKKSPYNRSSTYSIDIDNAFGVVKTVTNNGVTRYNVYDYLKGKVVCDEWFLSVGKLMTFDERISSGIKNAFQHDYERYNTKMFDTDNATYYAIVDTNMKIVSKSSKNQITAKNVLVFNHNSCEYLFKD